MSPTDTILVLVDAEARHHAGLAKAAILAQKYRARLELFSSGGSARLPALQSLAVPLRDGGLEVSTVTVCAQNANAALALRLTNASTRFVIKDVVHMGSSPRVELSNADWQLARACPVPLLLSKPTLWSELPVICAAIDPLHDDDEMECLNSSILVQAAMLTRRIQGDLHVLHAYMPPTFAIAPAVSEVRAVERAQALMSAPAGARLRDLRGLTSGYQIPESHVHFLIGSVCEALSGCASQLGASVVVLGAISRAALRADVIGSTAEGLLKQISCDVLVVKRPHTAIMIH